jgi:hypothetical protein
MNGEFVDEINTLLSSELSAMHTYDLALQRAKNSEVIRILKECRNCHGNRANMLSSEVRLLCGIPKDNAGVWGKFESWVQNGASSERDAVALLEESEAERLINYESDRTILPEEVRCILERDLLPAQHKTHLAVSCLLHSIDPLPIHSQISSPKH